ncbi:hypothetical protein [Luteimonas salinilitoris]|uniref:Uncharacterized protein n=1 Tax=Luteimonas salinilitoris TaxID=3237697 RepID=A0ABV4HQF5_9GAMM
MTRTTYILISGAVIAAFAGGIFTHRFFVRDSHSGVSQSETYRIMQAVVASAGTQIARERDHCEITHAGDGPGVTKVGDFIASSSGFRFEGEWKSFENLRCDGEGTLKCEWAFGKAKSEEGWGRILRFTYVLQTGAIDTASFECLDVP